MKGYTIVNRKFGITVWSLLAGATILCAVAPGNAQENKALEKKPNIGCLRSNGETGRYIISGR